MQERPIYLHIGLMKTGTTYLQARLRGASQHLLDRHGLTLVPRNQLAGRRLSIAVRTRSFNRAEQHQGHRELERLPRLLDAAPGPSLLTEETLSFADAAGVERLGAALGGHPAHLVVTLRDLARAIPSAWQQRVRNGNTLSFDDYMTHLIEDRGWSAGVFWQTHRIADLLERWSALVPPERMHVVVVPPAGQPADLLLERFCSVLGVDADALPPVESRSNRSLGYTQVELLRRVSELLPDELRTRQGHGSVVKRFFALEVLGAQGGEPVRMLQRHREWCEARAEEAIDHLRAGAYDVVGDLDDLRPVDSAFVESQILDESAIAASAATAITAMLTERYATASHDQGSE